MNFIDKAFENNLKGDDFLQAMADVYSEHEVRICLLHTKCPEYKLKICAKGVFRSARHN